MTVGEPLKLEQRLIQILVSHEHMMRDLLLVQNLQLPNWCIAAGYVRNLVWDNLHGYVKPTPLNDIDVLYYDLIDRCEETEKAYESILKHQKSDSNWSVKNQARMHIRNRADSEYSSITDAMKRWPETATAVGVRLNTNNEIEIIAPHGLRDLFDLMVRRSPYFNDNTYFKTRVMNKKWLDTWPKLKLIEDIN